MVNIFSRIPAWMYGALRLQEPSLPIRLETGSVVPVLDAFQSGWGLATYQRGALTRNASLGAGRETLIEPDDDRSAVLLGLESTHNAGAAAGVVQLEYYDTITSTGITFGVASIGVDTQVGLAAFLGAHQMLFIPPGYGLTMRFPATGLGETYAQEFLWAAIPAGFAPLR